MSVSQLSVLAMRGVVAGACRAVGCEIGHSAVEGVVSYFHSRLNDPSQKMLHALSRSAERAWRAIEIALAGESLLGRLDRAEDRAFREQIRLFLAALTDELPGKGIDFRRRALADLHAARKEGLLITGQAGEAEAQTLGTFARYTDPAQALEAEWALLDQLGERIRRAGYDDLGKLVQLRGSDGNSLLAVAVRFFFRQEVIEDPQLFHGVALERIDTLGQQLEEAFQGIGTLLTAHGDRMERLLDSLQAVVVQTHGAVLDLGQELQRQGEESRQQFRDLYEAIQALQERLDLGQRELRPRDSLSIRSDSERQAVKRVVTQYRNLPAERRRSLPALLHAIGKLEVAAGSFAEARQDFDTVAGMVGDAPARGAAHFNAYLAALEERQFDQALAQLSQAVAWDGERFAPFPWHKYQPVRILGAGGFGVTFLCRYLATGGEVAVKVLMPEGLEREISTVFQEAGALDSIHHPAIIRLRECDFADPQKKRPYLVMEYFAGMTLEELVRERGPVTGVSFLVIFLGIAEALQAAHARGVLHRDIKPANLLVKQGKAADSWQVKIIDFGLALDQKLLTGATTRQGQTVMGSSIAGTIDYAAPEQMGKLAGVVVGPPADIYAFGRTCCYALFATPNPLRAHWRQVPEALADLLEACLHEMPQQRLQTFTEVADRLRALLQSLRQPAILEAAVVEEEYSRVLLLGLVLAASVENAGDVRGVQQILSCAARQEESSAALSQRARQRLAQLLRSSSAEPGQHARLLRRGIAEIVGDVARQQAMMRMLPAPDASPLQTVQGYVNLAIELGAPAYNNGDVRGCAEVYAAVARMIVTTVAGADRVVRQLREALKECSQHRDLDTQAWTLRHAFDAIAEEDHHEIEHVPTREAQPSWQRPGFSRPVSALLATLFLTATWGTSVALAPPRRAAEEQGTATAVVVTSPNDDPVHRVGHVIGMVCAAFVLSLVVGVPGGLIIRSYRGWAFVLAIALGVPLSLGGLGTLLGKPPPWDAASFFAAIGLCALLAYGLALPIKLILWLGSVTSGR